MNLKNSHISRVGQLCVAFIVMCAMALGAVISSGTHTAVASESTYTLNIRINNYEETLAEYSQPDADKSALTLEMWSLDRQQLADGDLQATLETLHTKTEAQLRAQYTSTTVPLTLGEQYLQSQGVTSGLYYVRGNLPLYGEDNKFEFMLDTSTVGNAREIDINAKPIAQRQETPKGNYYFLKVSDDAVHTPLAGAVFEVLSKDAQGNLKTYMRDGKALTVTSGRDGEFSITDLPYGNYALKEIKAPEGYILPSTSVDFTIGEAQDESIHARGRHDVIVITNHRVPPLAKTGVAVAILMVVVIGAIILGLLLKRRKQQRDI